MDYTREVTIDLVGKESGLRRSGKFKFKTLLTRRDKFAADEARRRIIGGFNPDGALLNLQEEAYVLGQLSVRVLEAPKWWTEAANGEELEDGNVIAKVYEEALRVENERKATLVASAEAAHGEMKKDAQE